MMIGRMGANRTIATSTIPKMKPYSPTVDAHLHQTKPRTIKGEYVPVYVSLGLILLTTSFVFVTAKQHLWYSPAVQVSKKRRGSLPELSDPDYVVDESDKFIKRSFFRKVAHVQDHNPTMPNTLRGDVYSRKSLLFKCQRSGEESSIFPLFVAYLDCSSIMAFRKMDLMRTLLSRRTFATSTILNSKQVAATVDAQVEGPKAKPRGVKGDYVPVYITLGMIALSVSLGISTAMHHLKYSPAVQVSKKKREELPEVEEPEYVADEAEKFINASFFRKVSHTTGDIQTRPLKMETLKSVGVDPAKK
ncbi:hypothetical protein IFM89_035141 [Coptis chinensis]|uniref:Uncharacterized protein n=1 Tax=Coptis chinensis TaxID=261450 RepID=A0A835ITP6_9MAGN|nr:hypothetical protein IFM89_035141 [Coptis chinensis]